MIKLNETPIRTSRNFLINNIKLDNLDIPENVKKFENVSISKGNYLIDENVGKTNLTYGAGKILEKNINENANSKINIKSDTNNLIKIIYDFDDNNLSLIDFIKIEAEGKLDLIIEYKSHTEKKCFHNGVLKLASKNNSEINVTIINFMNSISENLESIENEIEENAKVNYCIIDLGGKNSIQNYYSNVIGDNSINNLKSIYLGQKDEIKDINYIVELKGKKTITDIDVQGALKDNSKKNFKGTIDFKRGSTKSKGNENEYCMILSDKAKSLALPMLLCTEDDVEGNHSTASGKIDEEKLFYSMSRGFSRTDAIKLIVKANFSRILEQLSDDELRKQVIEKIDRRLD